jgi:hypothetical protein
MSIIVTNWDAAQAIGQRIVRERDVAAIRRRTYDERGPRCGYTQRDLHGDERYIRGLFDALADVLMERTCRQEESGGAAGFVGYNEVQKWIEANIVVGAPLGSGGVR